MIMYVVVTILFGSILAVLWAKSSSDKEKLRNEGIESFSGGDYKTAASLFEKSLEEKQWFSAKMDLDTKMYLGACYLRMNRYSDAVECYRQINEKNNGSIDEKLLISLTETAESMNEMEKYKGKKADDNMIEQMKNLARTQPYMYLCLASVYNERKETKEAREALENYIKVRPVNSYVAYELSTAMINEKKYAEAKDMLEQGLKASDNNYKDLLNYNRIALLEADGDLDGAFQLATELKEQYPKCEAIQKEYDFLYTRININTTPVNPNSDANETYEPAEPDDSGEESGDEGDGSDESSDEGYDDGSDEGSDDGSDEGFDEPDEGYDDAPGDDYDDEPEEEPSYYEDTDDAA